jgi:hypothetical protein
MIKKGQIMGFEGSWGSGIATLTLKGEDGRIVNIPCDNGPTVRSLESAYGNIIGESHTASIKNIKGKWIYYDTEEWGTLAGFTPEEEATPEVIEAYEKSKKKLREMV